MDDPDAATISDVLIPTDGSPAAEVAVDHCLDLASRYGATVHALYVVDVTAFPADLDGVSMDPGPWIEAMEEVGERATERIAERAQEYGVSMESTIDQGWVHDSILEYSSEAGIDLVVMGTHGRQGIQRYLLGSVAERVIRLSDVPVLAVPPIEGDPRTDYERILLPVEGAGTSTVARELAVDVAARYDATLHVLHVADVTRLENAPDADRDRAAGADLVDSIHSDAESNGVDVVTDVRSGDPFPEIRDYVENEAIDLAVMATHGRTGVNRVLLGSVTEQVLRTAEIPVLTCHTPQE